MDTDLSPGRKYYAFLILLLFLAGTLSIYGFYKPELEVEVEMTDKIRENDTSMYRGFNYTVRNLEDQRIKSRLYIIGPRQRGQVRLYHRNKNLKPGVNTSITGFIQEPREPIPPVGDYMLILKDLRTGEYNWKIFSFKNDYLSEKNPYFVSTKAYRFHWLGSIYGNGNYSLDTESKGLNASFKNCRSGCGFDYRDSYSKREIVHIEGVAENLDNKTSIYAEVAGKKFDLEVNNSEEGVQSFERTINTSQAFEKQLPDKIRYTIGFRTEKKEFHWIQINQYRFYNPSKSIN